MTTPEILSAASAAFNLTSATLAVLGVRQIRRGNREAHQKRMTAAMVASALFFVAYLTRFFIYGSTPFPGHGWIRTVYFVILGTHMPLAIGIVPFVIRVFYLGRKSRFVEHRKLARVVFPIWMYVSITGVIVYLLLHFWPVS